MAIGRRSIALFALPAIIASLLLCTPASGYQTARSAPPTPESVLGHKPGDDFYLASYDESLAYFRKLAESSDRIRLVQVGKTTEGRDWYVAVISSSENLRNLERYRDIARRVALVRGLNDTEAHRLAQDGKVIVHIDGGLHSTEVAHGQHTIQLAYNLVSGESDPEIKNILDNVILVLWFCLNPDGQNMVVDWYRRNLGTPYEVSPMPWLYQKYVGHDNNRDGYMNNMVESQVVTRATVREWFPMVFYNHHQTAPFPARIWIPPFAEPISTNMHPLMWRWTNVFGTAMASYLDQRGMPGSIHRRGFDDWYPGFIDNVNNYRNTISFLTETALYRYATPHFYTVEDFPKEFQGLRKEVFYASPWQGGWWRLGDAVRYMIGASMSVLDTAAKYKKEIIYGRYQAGRDVIAQFTGEPPFAYLIPQQQRDPQTAALLLEKLQQNGIEISRARQPLTANGREYPAGTWVIMMNQPFALLVKDLFDIQRYPDLRGENGAPDLPYDVVGWTLPLQMGVDVAAVTTPPAPDFQGKIEPVEKVEAPAGAVEGSGTHFILGRESNAAYRAVSRLFKSGGTVSLSTKEVTSGSAHFAPGSFVVSGVPQDKVQAIAGSLRVKVHALKTAPDSSAPVKAPRVGVYSSWLGNIDEGWTCWVLEQFEVPYTELRNADIQAGNLRERFDAVIIPEMGTQGIMDGFKLGTVPGEFVGGIGDNGLEALRDFVRSGGTLLPLGNASLFAIDKFNLPVKNILKGLKNEEFFCSGSILKTEPKNAGHPVLQGLTPRPAVFFARNAVFEPQRDFKGTVLLAYPGDENPLLSGYIIHPEKIEGKAAALDVSYGKGRIILTGFRPQWRGQTHGMFKFLLNALLYSTGPPAANGGTSAKPARDAEFAGLIEAIHEDLGKALDRNQKFVAARGQQAVEEGRQFDELVQKFQSTHFAALETFKDRAGAGKIDEYQAQLKEALVGMRGRDYSSVKFTLKDLILQHRLGTLERDIAESIQ